MVDISILNGIINQLITWGAPPCILDVKALIWANWGWLKKQTSGKPLAIVNFQKFWSSSFTIWLLNIAMENGI